MISVAEAAAIAAGSGSGSGSGGCDFIFKADYTTSTTVYSHYSGDFEAVVNKLKNREPVYGRMIVVDDNRPNYVGLSRLMSFSGAEYSEEDDYIITTWMKLKDPDFDFYFIWTPDNTVFED